MSSLIDLDTSDASQWSQQQLVGHERPVVSEPVTTAQEMPGMRQGDGEPTANTSNPAQVTINQKRSNISSNTKPNQRKPKIQQHNKLKAIEDYLSANLCVRYNTITSRIEWAKSKEGPFQQMDDYTLNTLVRKLEHEAGLSTSRDKVKMILCSEYTDRYHPVRAYFDSLSKLQVTEELTAINALAATVTVEDAKLFLISLTRWLVAAVANAFTPEGCQNQTCLVLTGDQGAFKTTWLNGLCPPALLTYLFCGRIHLDRADSQILLAEKLIINLDDQLRNLNKQDAETVKTYISQGTVTVRRPYAEYFNDMSRMASLCGSVNGSDFLTDPTGSRRFLPFEVTRLDLVAAKAIDINQVWAEAYALWQSGYQYWFTAEETANLFTNNEAFQVQTVEYEALLSYFEPVDKPESANAFLTATEILSELRTETHQDLRIKQLGEALRKAEFLRKGKKVKGNKGKDTTIYRYALCRREAWKRDNDRQRSGWEEEL